MSSARAIIAKLRQTQPLTKSELNWFAKGLSDNSITDAQAGAFAMAVCLNGLRDKERVDLTMAMRDSGQVLNWDLPGPVLDKHSTGGIGDCVSLLLAPALAACGAFVPMISGRGLGHSGGTLDKLESIPDLSTQLSETNMRETVAKAGCAIFGASSDIAPADKRLYAIRDVTATVESVDLITASILSKKLAAGLNGLVLDVKVGSGAFMKDLTAARALAHALVKTANAAGCKTYALLSDMSQPLVPSLGNALEVAEVMRALTGHISSPLVDLSAALGGVLLKNAGLSKNVKDGTESMIAAISNGRAAENFSTMIAAMGGPIKFVERWDRFLPEATVIREICATEACYISEIDGEALGLAVVELGGGRIVENDKINPAVGISDIARLGTYLEKDQPIAVIHATRSEDSFKAEAALRIAIKLGPDKSQSPQLIMDKVI